MTNSNGSYRFANPLKYLGKAEGLSLVIFCALFLAALATGLTAAILGSAGITFIIMVMAVSLMARITMILFKVQAIITRGQSVEDNADSDDGDSDGTDEGEDE